MGMGLRAPQLPEYLAFVMIIQLACMCYRLPFRTKGVLDDASHI
jgi:hypothetical protein